MTSPDKTEGRGSAESQPNAAEVVTVARINELVDVIVPPLGCVGAGAEAVALALVELAETVAGAEGHSFRGDVGSAALAAYHVARRAFERSQGFEEALFEWKTTLFEAALKKGGGS